MPKPNSGTVRLLAAAVAAGCTLVACSQGASPTTEPTTDGLTTGISTTGISTASGSTNSGATRTGSDRTGTDLPLESKGPSVAQLVETWTPAIADADGFGGTLTHRVFGIEATTTFRATNDSDDRADPHVGSVDLAQITVGDDGTTYDDLTVRRIGTEGTVVAGPSTTVRRVVGAEAAGTKNWVVLTSAPETQGFLEVAQQALDSTDPYRYLTLLNTADSVSVDDSSTATFTLPPDGFGQAFPHAFAGIPSSPDEATATVEFDSTTHTFTTITIDLVRTHGDLTGTWTLIYELDSFDGATIDMPPALDIAEAKHCDRDDPWCN